MSDSSNLGDCKMAYIEPFDNGKRALVIFALKKPITINGKTTEHAGLVLEEEQILQIVDGLHNLAGMRVAARSADRLIKIVGA